MSLLLGDCSPETDYENPIAETPKCSVYLREFREDNMAASMCELALSEKIPFCRMTKKTTSECEEYKDKCRKKGLPWWWEWSQENIALAGEKIMNDPQTLFYCTSSCLSDKVTSGEVMALKMDDTYYARRGFALGEDSEYMSLFNHYLLKAFETGILHRLGDFWGEKAPIKIGLTEPKPLEFNNVMFPFCLLGVAIILSAIATVVERVIKNMNKFTAKSQRQIFRRRIIQNRN